MKIKELKKKKTMEILLHRFMCCSHDIKTNTNKEAKCDEKIPASSGVQADNCLVPTAVNKNTRYMIISIKHTHILILQLLQIIHYISACYPTLYQYISGLGLSTNQILNRANHNKRRTSTSTTKCLVVPHVKEPLVFIHILR